MNPLEQYLERAREIIGDRTQAEQRYDREVLRWLRKGKPIQKAIAKANKRFPSEALQVSESAVPELQAHYEYLAEHEAILRKLTSGSNV